MKKTVGYGATLIGLYLIVAHGANFKTAAGGATNFVTSTVKALQGR